MILKLTLVISLLIPSLSCTTKDADASMANEQGNVSQGTSSLLETGESKGTLSYKHVLAELKYAYARRIKAPYDEHKYAYSLLLTDHPFDEEALKQKDHLGSVAGFKNHLHFVINDEGKILKMDCYLSAPGLSASNSMLYATYDRTFVTVDENGIRGELKEDGPTGRWSYDVRFKASLIKQ